MGIFKNFMRSLWGGPPAEETITPPIECDACKLARAQGKDACPDHHTHHDHAHPRGAPPV